MAICKAPTLRLKALNKHTHIMYIEMENVIHLKKKKKNIYRQVFKHNYAKDAHTRTHARTHARTHTHTHTHTHMILTNDFLCGNHVPCDSVTVHRFLKTIARMF